MFSPINIEKHNVRCHPVISLLVMLIAAANTLMALQALCAVIIDREAPLALFEAAEAHGVTAYDAAYLLLARSEGLPLATLDRKMRKVAKTMGIPVFGVVK